MNHGEVQYCVKSGDTLSDIAQRFLGDSSRWRELTTSPFRPGGVIWPGDIVLVAAERRRGKDRRG